VATVPSGKVIRIRLAADAQTPDSQKRIQSAHFDLFSVSKGDLETIALAIEQSLRNAESIRDSETRFGRVT
jgi:hypothetical protein